MRKSKFSETQIVGILKDAESGVPVADLLRKYGVSKATFFKWRSKYGGASVSDVKRLRELETENAKLKRMYADLALENAAIKDVLNRKLYGRSRSDRLPRCS
jgi:putative transposase